MSDNKITFEESLTSLEEVISKLESGELTLNESIKLFEKGMKHITECKDALKNAEEKITNLCDLEKE